MKAMSGFNLHRFLFATMFVMGLGCEAHAITQYAYLIDLNSGTATDLGSLGGGSSSAAAINASGQVVGTSVAVIRINNFDISATHAFITEPNGIGMRDLGTLGGSTGVSGLGGTSVASAINSLGQVTGSSNADDGTLEGFITGPDGRGMGTLNFDGVPDGIPWTTFPSGINDAGRVVGTYSPSHAFITGPNGNGITELDTLGGFESDPAAINTSGQVVGRSSTVEGAYHAFITGANGGGMRDLGTLGHGRIDYSAAYAVNDLGQVAGESSVDGGGHHAFITGPEGAGMTDLGTLGGISSEAFGINDAGQVVGTYENAEGATRPFVTGPSGVGMVDLNSLVHLPPGVILTDANGINNAGQVIATAVIVIPEPENYMLLLAGLALIAGVTRRCPPKKATE